MAPIVDLGYTKYSGRQVSLHCNVFLGVPYALPPVGERRFRNPVPVPTSSTSDSVVDASQYPLFAVQGRTGRDGDVGGAGSEDCLKVDIYTPTDASAESSYPVLAYIHGGGYQNGAPKNSPFDHWITSGRKVVIVAIYYRLSVLGYLSHPDFISSGLADLNVGIQDQVEALRWVQTHIAQFGGDPSKISPIELRQTFYLTSSAVHVTIGGQSAGASSVQLHLIANGGSHRHLFRGAIVQSAYRTPLYKPIQKLDAFSALLEELGCPYPKLEAQMKWLRAVNPAHLVQATDAMAWKKRSILYTWNPVVDGDLITDYPTKLIQIGNFADVPTLVGATTDETLPPEENFQAWMEIWYPTCPKPLLDTLNQATSNGVPPAPGDLVFRSSVSLLAQYFSNTWCYRFDQPTPDEATVQHSAECWVLFKGSRTGPNSTQVFAQFNNSQSAFEDELISYFTSFVCTGSPNALKLGRSPEWRPCNKDATLPRMVLQAHPSGEASSCRMETTSPAELDRYVSWLEHAEALQN